MNTQINDIIISGIVNTVTNYKERIAALMNIDPNFADKIMSIVNPVIANVTACPTLADAISNKYGFKVQNVSAYITHDGRIRIKMYLPKTFKYWVNCYSTLNENPEMDYVLEKDENHDRSYTMSSWEEMNATPFMEHILVETI